MHPALIVAALTLLPGLEPSSEAQTVPYETVITMPEVEVRSGPSTEFYATGKLRQGMKVTVVKQEQDESWLAIKPPEGSFSWINSRNLDEDTGSPIRVVLSSGEPVRIGTSLSDDEPMVVGLKLDKGTSITVLNGKKVYAWNSSWLMIAPTPREVRYIPASAVKAAQVQPAPVPAAPLPFSKPENTAAQASPADSLWFQAEQAERAGNPAEAERLFLKLAYETSDHDLQIRCYNRIHFLRYGSRASYPAGYQPGRPNEAYYPNTWNVGQASRLSTGGTPPPYAQPGNPYTLTGRASSQYTYTREIPVPTVGQGGPVGYGPNPAPAPTCQWSGWGWLRRAPFFVDNKPAFVLENSQGLPRLYVTAQPGVGLESYVNRSVNLYGKMAYRGDLRTNYMTACQLTPLP